VDLDDEERAPSSSAADRLPIVLEAHRRLMRAILEDVLDCFQKYVLASRGAKRRLFVEAERWLMGRAPVAPRLSFQQVCDALDLEPTGIRRALRQWRDRVRQTSRKDADRDPRPENPPFFARRRREAARGEAGGSQRRAKGTSRAPRSRVRRWS
jgi:hypothetical protein